MKPKKTYVHGYEEWYVNVPVGVVNGRTKYKKVFARTQSEAKEKAKLKLIESEAAASAHSTQLPAIAPNATLEDAYNKLQRVWEAAVVERSRNPKKGKNPDTVTRDEQRVAALFKIIDKKTQLQHISASWVENFILNLKTKKYHGSYLTDSQAARIWQIFGLIMDRAVKSQMIPSSPHNTFKDEAPTYSSPGKKAPSDAAMEKAYKLMLWYLENGEPKQEQAIVIFLLQLFSARWSEMAALQYKDINFNENYVFINKSKSTKTGAINLTKSGQLKTDKADFGERIVYFAPDFKNILYKYFENKHFESNDFIFDVTYSYCAELMLKIKKAVNAPELETRAFRRYFSSQMQKQGATRDDRKLVLGHSNEDTQDIYTTYDNSGVKKFASNVYAKLN